MASSDVSEAILTDEIAEYYSSILGFESSHAFRNLDGAADLEQLLLTQHSNTTRNFVLDFSDATAWYLALDLSIPDTCSVMLGMNEDTS